MSDKIHLRYDLYADSMERHKKGESYEHPSKVLGRLGITYKEWIPQTLFDQIWLIDCDNVPDELPEYIRPMQYHGGT